METVIVGRDKDLEALMMQFDTVLEGQAALTLIAGETGAGKTTLVKKALADLTLNNGTCVYGKFEPYSDNQPYRVIIEIIEQLTRCLLTLPEPKLNRIKKELGKKLGKNRTLIVEMVPQAKVILGPPRNSKAGDYHKRKIGLENALAAFITAAAKELYPLVIAVDDLQWADRLSWQILRSVYERAGEQAVYLILIYKNDLEEYRDKVEGLLADLTGLDDRLEITPARLTAGDIKSLLHSLFEGRFADLDDLAQLVNRKTAGNPLYIRQMLNLFLENHGVYYDPGTGCWHLDRDKAAALHLPDSIADFISSRIDGLSPGAKEVLETAACLGSCFTLEGLSLVTGYTTTFLQAQLETLGRLGLIIQTREGYEFFHNRIHQNAYEQIPPDRREALHYQIALALLRHPDLDYVDENLLAIAAHLLQCPETVKKRKGNQELAGYLYRAGLKAKQSAAAEQARQYFALAEALLEEGCWARDYEHTLQVKLELTECSFICGDYGAAESRFGEMLAHAATEEDLAQVIKRYMVLHSYAGDPARVIELGRQALRCLGFKLPTRRLSLQVAKEILRGQFLFRRSRLEAIKDAPLLADTKLMQAMEILTVMAASANLLDEELFNLIVLKIGNWSAKHGNSPYSPLGYAAHSLVLGNVLGDFAKADRLKDLALSLVDRFDEQYATTTYFCIGSYVAHWTAPARESLSYLQKAFESGMRAGDYLYCCYALMIMLEMLHSMGRPLAELEELLARPEKYSRELSNDFLRRSVHMFREHIRLLAEEDEAPADPALEPRDTNEVMIYNLLKIQRLYLEDRLDEALVLLDRHLPHLNSIRGYINQVDWVFYYLLVNLAHMQKEGGSSPPSGWRPWRRYRRKLRYWARLNPANHGGKDLLIEGLFRDSTGGSGAVELYEAALKQAEEQGHVLLQALSSRLAAAHFQDHPKLARVYAADACRLFRQWGAVKTARRLAEAYALPWETGPRVKKDAAEPPAAPAAPSGAPVFAAKLPDYQKKLESLALEKAYLYFLDVIGRETGADWGGILLERDGRLSLAYGWEKGRPPFKYPSPLDPEQVDFLPRKVIRYVDRTYETVFLPFKPGEGPFAADDYIKDRPSLSVLCLPLKYHNVFAGLIYLESRRDHCFDDRSAECIHRLSLHLVAKQALEKEAQPQRPAGPVQQVKLTEREREVLYYMAAGLSNKEIGEKLHISSTTVKTHALNLYGKLEVNTRVQAVIKARELNLL